MNIIKFCILIMIIIMSLNKTDIIIDEIEIIDLSKEEKYEKTKKTSIGYWNKRRKFIMY
jgi:hypothetical protein